jgi:hypothetical protein
MVSFNARQAGRSRPKEAVSAPQGFRSGEAGGRDFQNTPAKNETRVNSILINDYLWILNQSGWQETHIFRARIFSLEQKLWHLIISANKNLPWLNAI